MKLTRIALGLAIAGLSFGAHATNGYFSHGYGMKAKGMAGVSTAMTGDAFGGANNPATMAFAGNRLDLGVDLFSPIREASRSGSTGGLLPVNADGGASALDPNNPFSSPAVGGGSVYDGMFGTVYPDMGTAFANGAYEFWQIIPAIDGTSESDSNYHLIPEFGYNKMITNNLALGVTVYGNGGMNTNYGEDFYGGTANILGGSTRLGVDLMQLIIAPTIAYKINPNHSVGISPLIGYQRFAAEGLQAFAAISQDSSNLTNKGHDDAFGYGVRVGYYGRLTPTFAIGAAYASRMEFEEFDEYKGLFAEKGDFDIPENYNIGFAWQATPTFLVGVDYQRVNYSDVASVGNPSTNFMGCLFNGLGLGMDPYTMGTNSYCLGGDDGAGFGWQDVDTWKLGMEYKYSSQLTLRAGYSHADQPIQSRDVEFNILAPAVIEDHVTLGFTYTRANGDEVTMAYMHGFANDVKGPSQFFGGEDKIEMYQNSLGIQYSWKM